MSWSLLREAQRDSTLGARQLGRKLVLMFLARRADDAGVLRVGSRVIAQETGIDHRRVRRLLDELDDMGRIDLLEAGAAGRGNAHTWRVLSMAEWTSRQAAIEGFTPPFPADRKGGVKDTEKGASTPPLELTQNSPPTPPRLPSTPATLPAAPPAAPSLPGLGPGEEGLDAIGGRAAGRTGQVGEARERVDLHALARQAPGGVLDEVLRRSRTRPPPPTGQACELRRLAGGSR